MTEYITKEQAKDVCGLMSSFCERTQYLKSKIDELPPADVVEVVRCKDCRHHGKAGGIVIDGELVDGSVLDVCHILKSQVENEDFYCAFSTLKDGGESNV